MRVWVARDNDFSYEPNRAAVWLELGNGRFLWILNSGKHGIEHDVSMEFRFHPEDWEEL